MAGDNFPPTSPSEPLFPPTTSRNQVSEKDTESELSQSQTPVGTQEPTPSHLQAFFQDAIESTNPSLRHLASKSTLESLHSQGTSASGLRGHGSRWSNGSKVLSLSTNSEEQRHVGKPVADEQKKEETKRLEDEMAAGDDEDDIIYPGPIPLSILIIGLCLSVFLISLDRTIITTAIPFITNEFHSSDDIGWYGSAYLLTASAFQPLYGRIFTIFNMKWSYLASITVFEIGSLICGVAPNSVTLIVGRALAGLGSAGILTGSFVVVAHAVPLARRPLFTAIVGLMFGFGATAGPLLGGVFTDLVTWRCVGAATIASMILFFKPPRKHAMMEKSFFYRVFELDLVGNAIILGAAIMLFLALQFTEGGTSWSSAEIIGLLAGSGMTFVTFCVWQWWKADGALIPPRIIKQRTVAASCAVGFCIYSAILIHSYYLPIWFQGIKGDSAIHSGVNMIPYVVANALFSLLAGIFVSKNGYFTAPAIVGCAIGTIGCGLISTLDIHSSSSTWIGYEILASVGIGMAIQQGFTAVQIVLPLSDVAIGTAAVVAFQSIGGAIFVSVGNTILQHTLQSAVDSGKLPGVNLTSVITAGASGIRNVVSAEALPALLHVYNSALQKVFLAAIPMCGLACVASCFMEWRSVKDKRNADEEEARKAAQHRAKLEKSILDSHRKSTVSGNSISNELEVNSF
ncbi:Roquefortine meleagrin synthesis T [Hyphodiscus hymeniophilus]|uniref:Roquefortine meleagrin synthesis T n=1 Tax=Hyphodiscus hymeniophilus TaxID=353542 RepID=A0A9P6VDD9_9HELO|nr:Roquefortine meleagrin synthesis T [Hyphodiscus hymeniophilus]